jgi:hypothetical protein
MINLVKSLSYAHAELVKSAADGGDEKALMSTARKIETNLVPAIKALDEHGKQAVLRAVMASGSLKALKAIPEDIKASPYGGSDYHLFSGIDPIRTSGAYQREALKRGWSIPSRACTEVLQDIAKTPDEKARTSQIKLLAQNELKGYAFDEVVKFLFQQDATGAARIAPACAKLFKKFAKAHPKSLQDNILDCFCIFDPAAADENLFKIIAIYALMGGKAPARDEIEHDDMAHLAKEMFGREGRKALIAQTGGLEAYIASGCKAPVSIIAEFEQKRQYFRPPGGGRGRGGLFLRL